ncbi:MAG: thioredoxin [Bacteroidales bacterium]|nr:thioredoxin [Bacteroidales bacterium]MDD4216036.1 thioredoxin [Bacteroidales bacterium]MDY0140273.1 thioredoxin [Bacteroidales bacterium]
MKKIIYGVILMGFIATATVSCNNSGVENEKTTVENKEESFDDIINGNIPVIVDFYADWCQPCKIQGPIIEEIQAELGEQVRVIKVNVDYEDQLANKYGIKSIPTIMVFKNGKTIWEAIGVQQKETLKKVVLDAK